MLRKIDAWIGTAFGTPRYHERPEKEMTGKRQMSRKRKCVGKNDDN